MFFFSIFFDCTHLPDSEGNATKNMKYDQHSNFGKKLYDSDIDHKQSTSVSCLLLGRIQGVFL